MSEAYGEFYSLQSVRGNEDGTLGNNTTLQNISNPSIYYFNKIIKTKQTKPPQQQ